MVDIKGNIEETDIDLIHSAIENAGLNISKSIDKLTEQIKIANNLKTIGLNTSRPYVVNYEGLSKDAVNDIKKIMEVL